jgi:hypothetical protein
VCHHIGCRPFVGLEGRDPRDREVYTLIELLDQLFVCFIFCERKKHLEHELSVLVYRNFARRFPFSPLQKTFVASFAFQKLLFFDLGHRRLD